MREISIAATHDHDGLFRGAFLQREWKQAIARQVWTWCPVGERNILDIGGGTSPILSYYHAGTSIELDPAKVAWNRCHGCGDVNYLQGDGRDTGFLDRSFDWVLCIEVLEHVPDWERVIAEIGRILKPGGRAILATPDYSRWRWRAVEAVYKRVWPGKYCDDHVSKLDPKTLMHACLNAGMMPRQSRHIFGCDYMLMVERDAVLS